MNQTSVTEAVLRHSLLFIGLIVQFGLFSSCASEQRMQFNSDQDPVASIAAPYSIVIVIHGDGEYLYHNEQGESVSADLVTLAAAKRVGEQNFQGEVTIFHQLAKRNWVFIIPRQDGEMYYYRNGRLMVQTAYWRSEGASRFETEVDLYHQSRQVGQPTAFSLFAYFGHEIPEIEMKGYDNSYPDRSFSIHDLAKGLEKMQQTSDRFDMLVLSTCYGGSPYVVNSLGSFSRYIIASPDNLHLTYLALDPFENIDVSLNNTDVHTFAKSYARQSFDRLSATVHTAVSVAVYDVYRTKEFTDAVRSKYEQSVSLAQKNNESSSTTMSHCDCAEIPAFVHPTIADGVDILYRPATFGRSQNRKQHSGWECWYVSPINRIK